MHKVLLLALVACSSPAAAPDAPVVTHPDATLDGRPDAVTPDAPPDPLACAGQAAPSTAQDPLPIAGTLFAIDHYQVTPVADAAVVVRRRGDGSAITTVTTSSSGAFATMTASGGIPLDAYFTVELAGYRASRIDPGDPLVGGENALLVVASDAEIARWYADAGIAPATSTLIAVTVDCNHDVVAGSTLAVSPTPAGLVYYDDATQQWNPGLAASTNGYTLVAASTTSLTVTAHAGAIAFPPHVVEVPASTLTVAVVSPHS